MTSTAEELAAEALFVSYLQPSECPSRETLDDTVTAMILQHGSAGCAGDVAEEFGDHPESAARRMSWAHDELRTGAAEPSSDT